MQLNSHAKQYKLFMFNNLEYLMHGYYRIPYLKWQLLSVCCCCKSVCLGKISDVAWEKMHFTWFSRRDGFSPTRHQILPSPLRGSGRDTVSLWEKTPSLLENHVKCISSSSHSRAPTDRSRTCNLATQSPKDYLATLSCHRRCVHIFGLTALLCH